MLPPTLTKINSLKTLLVSKNQLSKFPFLDSSQLSNLEVLDLSKNSIQQLPEMIDIPSLNKLRLSQNNIKGNFLQVFCINSKRINYNETSQFG